MIPGINISRWQREINWGEVKRAGVKFAFIKATEFPKKTTQLLIDTQLEHNIQGAKDNGIYWGALHHFSRHIDPVLQAKIFCKVIGSTSSLPPVVEIRESAIKGERLNYKLKLFIEAVSEATEKNPIIYTDEGFWRNSVCHEKASHSEWARNYHLFLSQFTSLWPGSLYPWAAWDFWQHTDRGKIPGIETDVNMIWFNGSENELAEKFAGDVAIGSYPTANISIEEKHISLINEHKNIPVSELHEDFKGDYQEPNLQSLPFYSPRSEMTHGQMKIISENGGQSREEEWIRDYFFQTA